MRKTSAKLVVTTVACFIHAQFVSLKSGLGVLLLFGLNGSQKVSEMWVKRAPESLVPKIGAMGAMGTMDVYFSWLVDVRQGSQTLRWVWE